ncbi:hypothetical protein V8E51_016451 [Hyaloscypha variabilis]
MRNANHITNIWFERPAGVRPILIPKGFVFPASDGARRQWIEEKRIISILKDPLENTINWEFTQMITLNGLNLPSSPLVIDEVYPPHFWGDLARQLYFGNNENWYPGAMDLVSEVDTPIYKPNWGTIIYLCRQEPVAYVLVSHKSRVRRKTVIIVRYLQTPSQNEKIEVRLSSWPGGLRSLAESEMNYGVPYVKEKGVQRFQAGVASKNDGEFSVDCSWDTITLSTSESSVKAMSGGESGNDEVERSGERESSSDQDESSEESESGSDEDGSEESESYW